MQHNPDERDWLWHLEHLMAGEWASKLCRICKLSSGKHKAQADTRPPKDLTLPRSV